MIFAVRAVPVPRLVRSRIPEVGSVLRSANIPPSLRPPVVDVEVAFGRFGHSDALCGPSQISHPERTVFLSSSSDVVPILPALLAARFFRLPLPLPLSLPLSLRLPFSFGLRLTSRYSRHVAAVCPAREQNMHVTTGSGLRLGPRSTASAFAPASDFSSSRRSY